jgi:hypothetical protein
MDNSQTNLNTAIADALTHQLMGKKFYESKTFWANIIAAGAILVQLKYGFILSPEVQALLLTALNVGLRNLTDRPIEW